MSKRERKKKGKKESEGEDFLSAFFAFFLLLSTAFSMRNSQLILDLVDSQGLQGLRQCHEHVCVCLLVDDLVSSFLGVGYPRYPKKGRS